MLTAAPTELLTHTSAIAGAKSVHRPFGTTVGTMLAVATATTSNLVVVIDCSEALRLAYQRPAGNGRY